MRNSHSITQVLPIQFIPTLATVAGALLIAYVGLLAIVMTSGALQMQAAQTLHNTSATVGVLETKYLSIITNINSISPTELGFTTPTTIAYVTGSVNQPIVSMRAQ